MEYTDNTEIYIGLRDLMESGMKVDEMMKAAQR